MGYILDILIVALFAACVIYGAKKGFFKSLMSLVTGIAAYVSAYAFTPALSLYIKDKFIIDGVRSSLTKTFFSIAEGASATAGEKLYDVNKLLQDPQVSKMLESFGGAEFSPEKLVDSTPDAFSAVEGLANTVADPISTMISDVVAFGLLFVLSLLVLKIITVLVGTFFKLPVLSTLDKTMGVVFGIAAGVFFSMFAIILITSLCATLESASPGTFSNEIVENSLIIRLFSDTNILGSISGTAK